MNIPKKLTGKTLSMGFFNVISEIRKGLRGPNKPSVTKTSLFIHFLGSASVTNFEIFINLLAT